ncbi:AAA family ATPase, partial [Shewanella sp. T24-MNA-CIBAN-0130]
MRLIKARVENYRSIIDSGEFDIERLKTILVGPNEAGKTVLLRALQQLNKPEDVEGFDALRDYPRSKYNEITTGQVDPNKVKVVTGCFELEDSDKALVPSEYHGCQYQFTRMLNNTASHTLINAPDRKKIIDIRKSLARMAAHMDKQHTKLSDSEPDTKPSKELNEFMSSWLDGSYISGEMAKSLKTW